MTPTASIDSAPSGNRALWLGILGGPLLWFANQQINYLLVRWACAHDRLFVLHLNSLLFLALAAALTFKARRDWKRIRAGGDDLMETESHRRSFMAGVGLASSALFTFAIVVQWIPNLLLDPCQR